MDCYQSRSGRWKNIGEHEALLIDVHEKEENHGASEFRVPLGELPGEVRQFALQEHRLTVQQGGLTLEAWVGAFEPQLSIQRQQRPRVGEREGLRPIRGLEPVQARQSS